MTTFVAGQGVSVTEICVDDELPKQVSVPSNDEGIVVVMMVEWIPSVVTNGSRQALAGAHGIAQDGTSMSQSTTVVFDGSQTRCMMICGLVVDSVVTGYEVVRISSDDGGCCTSIDPGTTLIHQGGLSHEWHCPLYRCWLW